MKRITLYRLLELIVAIVYISVLILQHLDIILPKGSLVWCWSLLLLESVLLFIKYGIFKGKTSLWFAILLMTFGFSIGLIDWYPVSYWWLLPSASLSIVFTSGIVWMLFRENLQLKIVLIAILLTLPFVLRATSIIPLWGMIVSSVLLFSIAVWLGRYIPEKKGV